MGRRSFPGGIISSTEPSVTGYGASGMWTTQTAAQKKNSGFWPTPGITPTGPLVGPTIANVSVTDSNYTILNDTPYINSSGGYIKVSGTGFASGAVVYVGGSAAVTTSFISSTEVRAQVAAGSTSNAFPVYVVNTDSSVAIKLAAVTYSGSPSWSTAAALSNQVIDAAFSISLSATSDSAITYSLAAGSSLPAGTALSSGGVFSGTVTGLEVETTYSFSVVANDAENQDASRTFTVTVSVGDQYFYLTPLLLNGEANVWIRDSSVNNLLPTISGDTRPTAFSPYNAYWSGFSDGTGDYLTIGNNSLLAFGTSAYTIEFWFFGEPSIADYKGIVGNGTFALYFNSSSFQIWNGASQLFAPAMSPTVPRYRWTFLQIIRTSTASNGLSVYVDGVLAATGTDGVNWTGTGTTTVFSEGTSGRPLTGFVTDLRISSVARTPGVPTAPLSSDANTRLLTLQNRQFVDNSPNASTITRFGDAAIRSFSPYTDTDTTTGSGYFDGTGDSLSTTSSAVVPGSSNFTVECWIYPIGTQVASAGIFVNNSTGGLQLGYYSTTGIGIAVNGITWSIFSSVLPTVGAWNHVVFCRGGTGTNQGSVFLNGTRVANGTVDANFTTGTTFIGYAASLSYYFNGYIAQLRYVNSDVYGFSNTTITVPTSPLTAISGTQLLTLQYRTGDNNHRFIDESGIKALTTRAGNATQGTFSPFSPAGWSGYFDGSTSYLNSTIGALSGTWTVEFWVNITTLGAQYNFTSFNTGSTSGINIWKNTSNQLVVDDGANAQTPFSTVTFSTAGVWYHVAVTRDGTTTRGYINGALAGTNTFTPSSVTAVTIGRYNSPTAYLLGNMSNLRVVDGVVVYTGVFTPPTTALTATQSSGTNISAITAGQTLLLALQSNRFIDANTTPKTITVNGTPRIQAFSPFRGSGSYSPTLHGGSVYGNGATSYLTAAVGALGLSGYAASSDFTLECWAYPAAAPTTNWIPILCTDNGAGAGTEIRISQNHNAAGFGYLIPNNANSGDVFVGFGTLPLHQWHHLALVRYNNVVTLYRNGANVGFTAGATFAINNATAGVVNVMRNQYPSDGYFNGYVADVRIIKNQAMYTANFTVPTGPSSLTSNVALKLNFTNGGIVDATARNVIETLGDVKIGNVQSKFGTGSLSFDGTGDYLLVSPTPDLEFGGGDFTIEFWWYPTSTSRQGLYHGSFGTDWSVGIDYNSVSTNKIGIWASSNGSSWNLVNADGGGNGIGTTTISQNQWTHIAYVRSGTSWMLFVNGSRDLNITGLSGTIVNRATSRKAIGAWHSTGSLSQTSGYFDDFRITRFARYTANFSVPASAFLTK